MKDEEEREMVNNSRGVKKGEISEDEEGDDEEDGGESSAGGSPEKVLKEGRNSEMG